MDSKYLIALSKQLLSHLSEVLPGLSDQLWEFYVLDQLTFQQKNFVENAGYSELAQLDLAALLRITDRSWHEIARARTLPFTARNWLKETQTIRNR